MLHYYHSMKLNKIHGHVLPFLNHQFSEKVEEQLKTREKELEGIHRDYR